MYYRRYTKRLRVIEASFRTVLIMIDPLLLIEHIFHDGMKATLNDNVIDGCKMVRMIRRSLTRAEFEQVFLSCELQLYLSQFSLFFTLFALLDKIIDLLVKEISYKQFAQLMSETCCNKR